MCPKPAVHHGPNCSVINPSINKTDASVERTARNWDLTLEKEKKERNKGRE